MSHTTLSLIDARARLFHFVSSTEPWEMLQSHTRLQKTKPPHTHPSSGPQCTDAPHSSHTDLFQSHGDRHAWLGPRPRPHPQSRAFGLRSQEHHAHLIRDQRAHRPPCSRRKRTPRSRLRSHLPAATRYSPPYNAAIHVPAFSHHMLERPQICLHVRACREVYASMQACGRAALSHSDPREFDVSFIGVGGPS